MLLDQLTHTHIARSTGFSPQDDGHNVPFVATNRRDQIVSGGFGVTGLDPIHSPNLPQQAIMVVDVLSAIAEAQG